MTPQPKKDDTGGHATLLEALCAVQGEAETLNKASTAVVQTRSGGEYTYNYSDLADVVGMVRPLLAKHGLVWITLPGLDEQDRPALKYRLAHAATGEAIEDSMPLLMGPNPGPQDMGSAITYARRYALQCVLNLVGDVDDDGRAAQDAARRSSGGQQQRSSGPIAASDKQRDLINSLLKDRNPSAQELALILDAAGIDPGILEKPKWTMELTGGRDGTASALISFLKEQPVPTGVSDVPEPGPEEFAAPTLDESAEDVPFDPVGDDPFHGADQP